MRGTCGGLLPALRGEVARAAAEPRPHRQPPTLGLSAACASSCAQDTQHGRPQEVGSSDWCALEVWVETASQLTAFRPLEKLSVYTTAQMR